MIDIRQSREYANYLSQIGWQVERKNGVSYFIKKIPLIGSILKIQRPERIRYKDIKILSKKYRIFQIILEPKNEHQVSHLDSLGFRLSRNPYLPTKTLQIDLTQTKEQIFANFKKDCRLALRKTKDLRFKMYDLRNIKEFRKSWKRAVGWKRYVPSLSHLVALKKSFKTNCLLYYCTSTVVQSGAIFLKAGNTAFGEALSSAYYWQAFTDKKGRKLQAQYQIVWQGILWAKKNGAKIFDFEGIYDKRFPNKSWLGFSHFKRSFGGYEVSYPGCYTRFRFL